MVEKRHAKSTNVQISIVHPEFKSFNKLTIILTQYSPTTILTVLVSPKNLYMYINRQIDIVI